MAQDEESMNSETRALRNRGRLRNGNLGGDFTSSPRCGARTRRGTTCQAPAMKSRKTGKYTRCRRHGGASTGPRTAEGRARCGRGRLEAGRASTAKVEG